MKLSLKQKNNRSGFTLIEVMVAMVIIAVTASLIYSIFSNTARQQASLEDLTFALFIADSRLNEIYVTHSSDVKVENQEVQMAGRKWGVATKTYAENDYLTRIVIEVSPATDDTQQRKPAAILTGFIGKD